MSTYRAYKATLKLECEICDMTHIISGFGETSIEAEKNVIFQEKTLRMIHENSEKHQLFAFEKNHYEKDLKDYVYNNSTSIM